MENTPNPKTDDVGNVLKVGDIVRVTGLNSNRGAYLNMTQEDCTVIAFGRTRVVIQCNGLIGTSTVGAELLHITKPVDGRTLIRWADKPLADLTTGASR